MSLAAIIRDMRGEV